MVENLQDDLEEKQNMVTSLTGIMDKITKENQHLRAREAELQVNSFCVPATIILGTHSGLIKLKGCSNKIHH